MLSWEFVSGLTTSPIGENELILKMRWPKNLIQQDSDVVTLMPVAVHHHTSVWRQQSVGEGELLVDELKIISVRPVIGVLLDWDLYPPSSDKKAHSSGVVGIGGKGWVDVGQGDLWRRAGD